MRHLAVLIVFATSPAVAQILPGQAYDASREAEAVNQQMMARQRDIALQNQLTAMDAQLRADQAVRQSESARNRPGLPLADPTGAPAASTQASIPEDRLAASRERVRDAAENRR